MDRTRIDVWIEWRGGWIFAARRGSRARREGEEREVDSDVVALGAEQKSFKVALESLVDAACCVLNETAVGHPHAGANECYTVVLHLIEVSFPDPCVARTGEVPSVGFSGEVVGADGEKRRAVARDEVAMHAERRTGCELSRFLDPEAVLIEGAEQAGFAVDRGDFVEARRQCFVERHIHIDGAIRRDGKRG